MGVWECECVSAEDTESVESCCLVWHSVLIFEWLEICVSL